MSSGRIPIIAPLFPNQTRAAAGAGAAPAPSPIQGPDSTPRAVEQLAALPDIIRREVLQITGPADRTIADTAVSVFEVAHRAVDHIPCDDELKNEASHTAAGKIFPAVYSATLARGASPEAAISTARATAIAAAICYMDKSLCLRNYTGDACPEGRQIACDAFLETFLIAQANGASQKGASDIGTSAAEAVALTYSDIILEKAPTSPYAGQIEPEAPLAAALAVKELFKDTYALVISWDGDAETAKMAAMEITSFFPDAYASALASRATTAASRAAASAAANIAIHAMRRARMMSLAHRPGDLTAVSKVIKEILSTLREGYNYKNCRLCFYDQKARLSMMLHPCDPRVALARSSNIVAVFLRGYETAMAQDPNDPDYACKAGWAAFEAFYKAHQPITESMISPEVARSYGRSVADFFIKLLGKYLNTGADRNHALDACKTICVLGYMYTKTMRFARLPFESSLASGVAITSAFSHIFDIATATGATRHEALSTANAGTYYQAQTFHCEYYEATRHIAGAQEEDSLAQAVILSKVALDCYDAIIKVNLGFEPTNPIIGPAMSTTFRSAHVAARAEHLAQVSAAAQAQPQVPPSAPPEYSQYREMYIAAADMCAATYTQTFSATIADSGAEDHRVHFEAGSAAGQNAMTAQSRSIPNFIREICASSVGRGAECTCCAAWAFSVAFRANISDGPDAAFAAGREAATALLIQIDTLTGNTHGASAQVSEICGFLLKIIEESRSQFKQLTINEGLQAARSFHLHIYPIKAAIPLDNYRAVNQALVDCIGAALAAGIAPQNALSGTFSILTGSDSFPSEAKLSAGIFSLQVVTDIFRFRPADQDKQEPFGPIIQLAYATFQYGYSALDQDANLGLKLAAAEAAGKVFRSIYRRMTDEYVLAPDIAATAAAQASRAAVNIFRNTLLVPRASLDSSLAAASAAASDVSEAIDPNRWLDIAAEDIKPPYEEIALMGDYRGASTLADIIRALPS